MWILLVATFKEVYEIVENVLVAKGVFLDPIGCNSVKTNQTLFI